jgi:hypothetical protein
MSDNLTYENKKIYTVTFPHIKNENDINNIIDYWSNYTLTSIIEDNNFLIELTLLSIDPIRTRSNSP